MRILELPLAAQAALAGGIGFIGVVGITNPDVPLNVLRQVLPEASALAGCDIKGNISINSGERIYHVPGQEYYAVTRISPTYGERWFCSEAEARDAGWRRSRV